MAVTPARDLAHPFDRMRWVAKEVGQDVTNDAKAFDGKPFTGLTVGTQFGNHAAAIEALARLCVTQLDMIEALTEQVRELREWRADHDDA